MLITGGLGSLGVLSAHWASQQAGAVLVLQMLALRD
jgi:hypothetical protein